MPSEMDCQQPQSAADASSPMNFASRARRAMTGFFPWKKGTQTVSGSSTEEFLPIVDFSSAEGVKSEDAAARVAAAQAVPGFEEVKRLIIEAMAYRADTLTLETTSASTIRLDVDGVQIKPLRPETGVLQGGQWKEFAPLSRDLGIAFTRVLRVLSGLPDSGSQTAGAVGFTVDRAPCLGRWTAARATNGERVTVHFVTHAKSPATLGEAGMPEPMADRLAQLVDRDKGLLLLSSPPGHGLTTSLDLLVEASDRFLRDFVAITGRDRPGREILNLATMAYGHKDDPAAVELLKTAINKNVGVIIAPDVRDKDFVIELVKAAATKAMVLMSIKAMDAVEAVGRVMKCGVDAKVFGSVLRGSLSQCLVRRLCPRCRVQSPLPAAMRSGSRSRGEPVAHVFTAARHGCQLCRGVGYRGRTGIFELASGETLRQIVASGGGSERLRQAALKDGMQRLRDAGLELVSGGMTSLEEIERVFASSTAATTSRSVRES